MSGIVHDENAHLYVLHVETLKFAQGLDFNSCQCHWYVGSAHNSSEMLPVTPPGQKYMLDFCTFVVADVEADVEVKLTVATVEGEHFAVYFGQLTGLAQDQQFVRRDLELKNVQGTVATAAVFCALQQRWTVGRGACARLPGDALVVGHEDTQASYVLQHIFPEAEPTKAAEVPKEEQRSQPGAEQAEKIESEKVPKTSVKEGRRSSKVKRRSIRKRSTAGSETNDGAVAAEKTEILERMIEDSAAPASSETAMDEQNPCPSCCGIAGSPSRSPGDSDGTSPTRAESETCDAPEEPKALEVEDESLATAAREQGFLQAPATRKNSNASICISEPLAPSEVGSTSAPSEKALPTAEAPGRGWRAGSQRSREPTEAPPATRKNSSGSICVSDQLAPSEVGSTTASAPSEKTAPSEEPRLDVQWCSVAQRSREAEAASDSEPELPLPSQQELAEEMNVRPKVQRGPSYGLWCRAQRAYAEDAKQCFRRPQEMEGEALWLNSRDWQKEVKDEKKWKSAKEKISQATALPSKSSTGSPGRSADGWEVDQRGRWFRVMATALSIRSRPEVDAPLAGELPFGEVFQAVSSTGEDGFRFLELSRGRGWVFSDARVQPVLVIDDTGHMVTEMESAERRPQQVPVEAEAEPEPSCQSPRISKFKAKKPLRSWTTVERQKPLRGRSRGSHERLQRPSQTIKETPKSAAPAATPVVTAEVAAPVRADGQSGAVTNGERRPPALIRASTGSPIRATRAWSMEPEVVERAETRELKIDPSGPLQAWPRQPVRANHSLASQCFTPSQSFGAGEPDRGSRSTEIWTPWKPGAWRRARSAEAQNFRTFWDFRTAKENLEERQRIQAALLKVALRAHPDDAGIRSTSMPARCRSSLKRLHLFDETLVDGHWNNVTNVTKRPISRRSSAHDLCDVPPGRLGATRERLGRCPGAPVSVLRHSSVGATCRGQSLTPRPELSEDRVAVCPRYGIADILLRV